MGAKLTTDEMARLAVLVDKVAEARGCSTPEAISALEDAAGRRPPARTLFEYAARVHELRIARDRRLDTRAFRDPAWEMVLDLLVAQDRGRDSCISDLCASSGVPATTALRHLERLERQGMVTRQADDRDNRRSLIRLNPEKRAGVLAILADLQECG